jgi:hypothetical protein
MARRGPTPLRRWPAALAACVGVSLAAALVAGSCTVFDGLTAAPPDAAPPPPPDAAPDGPVGETFLSLAEGALFCSRMLACPELGSSLIQSAAIAVDALDFSQCMDWATGPLPPSHPGVAAQSALLLCIAHGKTCEDSGTCCDVEQLASGDPRCVADLPDGGAACIDDGGTVLDCTDLVAIHCDTPAFAPGTQCRLGSDGILWCAASGLGCDVAAECVGETLTYCGEDTGLKFAINCLESGNTCGDDPDAGFDDCLEDGHSHDCTAPSADCNGTRVEVCDGANYASFDCGDLGGSCVLSQGEPRCTRPGDVCSPYDTDIDQCSDAGETISLCIAGQKTSFDCADVGLHCIPAGMAESGHCG